jgi:hypothetical protein
MLSFVDGRIDDITSSDKSKTGVTSSSKEKSIKEDAEVVGKRVISVDDDFASDCTCCNNDNDERDDDFTDETHALSPVGYVG